MARDPKVKIKVEADTRQAQQNLKGVNRELRTTDQVSKQAGGGLSGLTSKYNLMAGGAFVAVGAVTSLARAAINMAKEFDAAQTSIARATGATGKDLERHWSEAKRVMGELPDSMSEVAASYGAAATLMADSSQKAIGEMTRQVHDFARIAGGNATVITEQLGRAGQSWGLGATQVASAIDVMTGAAQKWGIDGGKLARQLQEFGPLFKNAGLSIQETTVLFGALSSAGINVSRVGPAINRFGRDVAAAGGDIRTELGAAIETIRNAESTTMALDYASKVFGAEGAQRMVAAIRSGAVPALEELAAAAAEARVNTGQVADETATASERISEAWNKIKLNIEPATAAVLEFGLQVQEAHGAMTNLFATASKTLITAATDNPVTNWLFQRGGGGDGSPPVSSLTDAYSSALGFGGQTDVANQLKWGNTGWGGTGQGFFWLPGGSGVGPATQAALRPGEGGPDVAGFFAGQQNLDQTASALADIEAMWAGMKTAAEGVTAEAEQWVILAEHFGQEAVDQAVELGATREELWQRYQDGVETARLAELDTILTLGDTVTDFSGTLTEALHEVVSLEQMRAEVLEHISEDELARLEEMGATVEQIWEKIEAHSQRMLDAAIDAALQLEDISKNMKSGPGGGVLTPGNGMQEINPNDPLFWTDEQRRANMTAYQYIKEDFEKQHGPWDIDSQGFWRRQGDHEQWRQFYNAHELRRGSPIAAWDGSRAPTAAEIAASAEQQARERLINQGAAQAHRESQGLIRELERKLAKVSRDLEKAAGKQMKAADKQLQAADPNACGPAEHHVYTAAGPVDRAQYRAMTRSVA